MLNLTYDNLKDKEYLDDKMKFYQLDNYEIIDLRNINNETVYYHIVPINFNCNQRTICINATVPL